MGILLIIGSAIALVFLTISAYFCVRKRFTSVSGTTNRNSGTDIRTATYSVGYNVESNVVIAEPQEFDTSINPDVIPRSKGNFKNAYDEYSKTPILEYQQMYS